MRNLEVKGLLSSSQPSLVTAADTLFEVAAKLIEDPTTREVYVVDDVKRFIGVIPLRRLVRFVFASEVPGKHSATEMLELVSAECAGHLALKKSAYVHSDHLLAHAVEVMFRFDLNEIPVVDADLVVVGCLNMLEILAAWHAGKLDEPAD